ncbi:Lrp/AsnC family transcriptional regulator [Subtercola frigoramans]|uniref:DNA-binding Lrp family transcriptional regulator n=1 Tax=Subtercola frigoramans TaxID=120298 RepID=A0ABS2L8N7_9MICO|nr:Lrp/AsnC family transcriptional regulator [Subtercola frigoramans]MBM7473455.1 DNA-binding Lrp family transcriptional regulator [Subtercola frigoramans]
MPDIDATDRRILRALDDDPRAPVLLLAQRLGLARGTIQARLDRLTRSNSLLAHSVRVEPAGLGLPIRAFVTAEVEQDTFDQTIHALAGIREVIECSAIAGADDIICQVVARDPDDLYEVGQAILRCPGIRRTATSIVLRQLMPHRMAQLLVD